MGIMRLFENRYIGLPGLWWAIRQAFRLFVMYIRARCIQRETLDSFQKPLLAINVILLSHSSTASSDNSSYVSSDSKPVISWSLELDCLQFVGTLLQISPSCNAVKQRSFNIQKTWSSFLKSGSTVFICSAIRVSMQRVLVSWPRSAVQDRIYGHT